ncbi:MAG: TonB C-terminal domain-containing protein [Gemmatimonadota bacterium]
MNLPEPDRPLKHGTQSTWGSRLRRRRSRPPRRAVAASLLLHVAVIAIMWVAGVRLRPELPDFVQYRVTLVSPPAQVLAEEPEPVETITPVIIEPEPEPEPVPVPVPKPAETPTTQAVTPPVEKKPDPQPAKGPDPKPVAIGGEDVDVDIEGAEFPYPDYLENIMGQLRRYFRWNGPANLEAEVVFNILRDGSVGPGIRLVRKSGNFNFDLQAVEAVELAGRNRAFGTLPEGWQGDRLWISFTFKPPS